MFRAVQLLPKDADLRNHLGMILALDGRLNEAEAQLQEAVRLKPDFREAHVRLGNVLTSLGRADEAKTQYALGMLATQTDPPPSDDFGSKQ
jgi:Flp pilus assembly protein TadD